MFKFALGHRFEGTEVDVVISKLAPAVPEKQWVATYHFDIVLHNTDIKVGAIDTRIGYTDALVKYGGHIGYGVDAAHRGQHFAAKACQLIRPVFRTHGMDVVWITCNPDNWPSRKTCAYIGCELVEIVDLPEESDMYQEGERQKCRYRWVIYP